MTVYISQNNDFLSADPLFMQWLFLLEGFPAVLLGVGIFVYLSKSPEDAKFLRPDEKAWLAKR